MRGVGSSDSLAEATLAMLAENPELLKELSFHTGRKGRGWHWYDRRGAPGHAGWTFAPTFSDAVNRLFASLPNGKGET